MTDHELELHIKDCGAQMLAAHGRGDLAGAREWLRVQNAAIAARSSAQVTHMESCYFAAQGDLARARSLAA